MSAQLRAQNDSAAPYIAVLNGPTASDDAKGDACSKLMDLGPRAKSAVPALVAQLKNPKELMRDYAVSTLSSIGAGAGDAIPALRQVAASDSSPDIRMLAQDALKTILAAGGVEPKNPSLAMPNAPPAAPAAPPTTLPALPPVSGANVPATQPNLATPLSPVSFKTGEIGFSYTPAADGTCTGTITFVGKQFPFTGKIDGHTIKGQFASGPDKFDFTATIDGNKLTLESGGQTYSLDRTTL